MFGMFDKDREIGLQMVDWIDRDTPFILWGIRGPIEVILPGGQARQTTLTASKLDAPQDRYDINTLSSPIADKAPEATPDEFPALVQWTKVDSSRFPGQEATVLRFLKPYGIPSDPSNNAVDVSGFTARDGQPLVDAAKATLGATEEPVRPMGAQS